MAVPGLAQHEQIQERLQQLSPQMQTALATACAERVLPVLEDYYGKKSKASRTALDLSWRFALGEGFAPDEAQATADECEALIEELYDDDEDGATLYALNAIFYSLQSTLKNHPDAIDQALSNASDAAHTGDKKKGKSHINEEADWQLLALGVALQARKISRDMFKQLPAPPHWLTDFYESGRALSPPIA